MIEPSLGVGGTLVCSGAYYGGVGWMGGRTLKYLFSCIMLFSFMDEILPHLSQFSIDFVCRIWSMAMVLVIPCNALSSKFFKFTDQLYDVRCCS